MAHKTKEYTRRAVDKYTQQHDRIGFYIDKGEKTRWLAVGLDNPEITRIIREEYNRRIGATDIMPQQEPDETEQPGVQTQTTLDTEPEEKPFMPKPTNNNFF